jgi:hypothetical protein
MWLFDWDQAAVQFESSLKSIFSRHNRLKFEAGVIDRAMPFEKLSE